MRTPDSSLFSLYWNSQSGSNCEVRMIAVDPSHTMTLLPAAPASACTSAANASSRIIVLLRCCASPSRRHAGGTGDALRCSNCCAVLPHSPLFFGSVNTSASYAAVSM